MADESTQPSGTGAVATSAPRRRWSLGIGATANCNLNCEHCYSRPLRGTSLSFAQFKQIVDGKDKDVHSVNFGTGENILNPDFGDMIDYCHGRGIKLSVTSNGYTINQLSDDQLRKFNDVDISLDFPDGAEQDSFRKGNSWNFVGTAIRKCQRLGVEFSIATALMNVNYKQVPQLLKRAAREHCNLRMNVFKPVPRSQIYRFQLDYDQFWEAMAMAFAHGRLISCSDPIVNAVLEIPPIVPQSPCGRESLRVHPNGDVVPCVYWVNSDEPIQIHGDEEDPSLVRTIPAEYWTKDGLHVQDMLESFEPTLEADSFKQIRTVPEFCTQSCKLVDVCGGGCASRRYLNGRLSEPDQYCPFARGKEPPRIKVEWHDSKKDLVHSAYLCTLILAGKD